MYILLKSMESLYGFVEAHTVQVFVLNYMRQCSSTTTGCPHGAYFYY